MQKIYFINKIIGNVLGFYRRGQSEPWPRRPQLQAEVPREQYSLLPRSWHRPSSSALFSCRTPAWSLNSWPPSRLHVYTFCCINTLYCISCCAASCDVCMSALQKVSSSRRFGYLRPGLQIGRPTCLSGYLLPAYRYFHAYLASCLPVYLSTCLTAYLPPCLSAYLPTCIPVFLSICLSAYLPTGIPAFLSSCLTAYLSTAYMPPWIGTYLPSCLPVFLSIRLPTYLPTCLPACLPVYLPTCLPAVRPFFLVVFKFSAYLFNG
jgi:hypothetical protein